MGKLIGVAIGFIFGPIGALVGLFIGALFDLRSRNGSGMFMFFNNEAHRPLLHEGLAAYLAALTIQNGLTETTVKAVKSIMVQQLGLNDADSTMRVYRELVEGAWSDVYLSQVSQKVLFFMDYQQKALIIISLFAFLDAVRGGRSGHYCLYRGWQRQLDSQDRILQPCMHVFLDPITVLRVMNDIHHPD